MANVILIGMPGCGKSTVGPLLGRPFYDCDAEIERAEGRSVADIFDTDGEESFRRVESDMVAKLCLLENVTIATGGGAVKNPANMEALKQNGIIVFLERPRELIDTHNADRPLLRRPGQWERLYAERLPLYRQYADFTVVNDTAPEDCAKKIMAFIFCEGKGTK